MGDFRTGNGADWLDFLATLLGRYRDEQVEMLAGPDDLRAWLAEHGWEPAVAPSGADVVAARRLREALHRLAVSAVQGRPPAASDVGVLNEALPAAAALRVAPHDGSLRMGPPPDAGAALARLAGQAAFDLTGAARQRLRPCGDESCSGVFLDQTGRRRWCSDERCGVRLRVRAHRARARAQGEGTPPGRGEVSAAGR